MEPITKTISRAPNARNERLIITVNRYAVTSLLAWPIIAGLEMYYTNLYGKPGTTYIGGFWTIVYGAWWLTAHNRRRRGIKRIIARLMARGQNVEESITFSDEWLEATFDEYFTARYRWASITTFGGRAGAVPPTAVKSARPWVRPAAEPKSGNEEPLMTLKPLKLADLHPRRHSPAG